MVLARENLSTPTPPSSVLGEVMQESIESCSIEWFRSIAIGANRGQNQLLDAVLLKEALI